VDLHWSDESDVNESVDPFGACETAVFILRHFVQAQGAVVCLSFGRRDVSCGRCTYAFQVVGLL
jgi:hypothetical protein